MPKKAFERYISHVMPVFVRYRIRIYDPSNIFVFQILEKTFYNFFGSCFSSLDFDIKLNQPRIKPLKIFETVSSEFRCVW